MEITCPECSKLFSLDESLMPATGRLLQCGICNYKWFYKLNEKKEFEKLKIIKKEFSKEIPSKVEYNQKLNESLKNVKEISSNRKNNTVSQNNFNSKKYFNIFLVTIITLIATILLLDTFKKPLSSLFPNINFLLNNLYETLKDLILFFNNLIS